MCTIKIAVSGILRVQLRIRAVDLYTNTKIWPKTTTKSWHQNTLLNLNFSFLWILFWTEWPILTWSVHIIIMYNINNYSEHFMGEGGTCSSHVWPMCCLPLPLLLYIQVDLLLRWTHPPSSFWTDYSTIMLCPLLEKLNQKFYFKFICKSSDEKKVLSMIKMCLS